MVVTHSEKEVLFDDVLRTEINLEITDFFSSMKEMHFSSDYHRYEQDVGMTWLKRET